MGEGEGSDKGRDHWVGIVQGERSVGGERIVGGRGQWVGEGSW